ncbi:hypothetical protein CYMTET_55373 [Cymbomonas tetramitiformis]|uniref:Uncharacterized protein n=1 Tax=Cymbomonas tetramitiformis TaxID=36881 RepID=A0AAE0BEF8_9CHLO|nr:hypothetical protein CYMTET_55373 [Cymbomonas tetramitiformis]
MQHFFFTQLQVVFGCVAVAVAKQQEYPSQNFHTADPYAHSPYSNVIAAKNGFQVLTNLPERGLTETLRVTHTDGLFVADEKVVMQGEHQAAIQADIHTHGVPNNTFPNFHRSHLTFPDNVNTHNEYPYHLIANPHGISNHNALSQYSVSNGCSKHKNSVHIFPISDPDYTNPYNVSNYKRPDSTCDQVTN